MELFLMTLVIPMFGIFGALLGSIAKNFGLGKTGDKGVPPPPPVGGILPTVAQLFMQRVKAKQQQQKQTQQEGSTGDMMVGGAPSEFFRRLSEGGSKAGRQLFGQERMRGSGRDSLGGDGFWSKIIEEVVRKHRGGQ